MKYARILTSVAGVAVACGISFTSFAASSSSSSSVNGSCMAAAVNTWTSSMVSAINTRGTAVVTAWNSNDTNAVKEADKTYQETLKTIEQTFKTAAKSCGAKPLKKMKNGKGKMQGPGSR